jgi:hypothetical protein
VVASACPHQHEVTFLDEHFNIALFDITSVEGRSSRILSIRDQSVGRYLLHGGLPSALWLMLVVMTALIHCCAEFLSIKLNRYICLRVSSILPSTVQI